MRAKSVGPTFNPKSPSQSTLNFKPKKANKTTKKSVINSSRDLKFYPLCNASLTNFYNHLRQIDGGRRNTNAAKAICKDISKFLFFASEKGLNMDYMIDVAKVSV